MKWIEHVNMSKNQYVDSVMRVLDLAETFGYCEIDELRILLEEEYERVLLWDFSADKFRGYGNSFERLQ